MKSKQRQPKSTTLNLIQTKSITFKQNQQNPNNTYQIQTESIKSKQIKFKQSQSIQTKNDQTRTNCSKLKPRQPNINKQI